MEAIKPISPRLSSSQNIAVLDGVSKRFVRKRGRSTFRQSLIDKARGVIAAEDAGEFAISNVTLKITGGEAVGLIGGNGSGKSTLLRLLANVYKPTFGEVRCSCRIAPVLELGAGFHRELDGTENAVVFAAAIGMTPAEIRDRLPSMIKFSDLDDDIALPLKHFSTGMQARLALSVALFSGFELLLLDEALSVCDRSFREKAEARLQEFRSEGGAYVFVSHDMQQVRWLCERVVWMRDGAVHAHGSPATILEQYLAPS